MKTIIMTGALATTLMVSTTAFAQDDSDQNTASAETSVEDKKGGEPSENEIVVTGKTIGGDLAMDAFLNGDYETAEIEFQKRLTNIRRDRFSLETNAFAARFEGVSLEIANAGRSVAAGGPGGGAGTDATLSDFQTGSFRSFTTTGRVSGPKSTDISGRTVLTSGNEPGYLHYMSGLSQLQLGKYSEARKSFTRAIKLNRSLYDTHFRLGLLDLRDGDLEKAKERLIKLVDSWEDCRQRCDQKDELEVSIGTLASLIKKERDGG